jgi:hypothetical protein
MSFQLDTAQTTETKGLLYAMQERPFAKALTSNIEDLSLMSWREGFRIKGLA